MSFSTIIYFKSGAPQEKSETLQQQHAHSFDIYKNQEKEQLIRKTHTKSKDKKLNKILNRRTTKSVHETQRGKKRRRKNKPRAGFIRGRKRDIDLDSKEKVLSQFFFLIFKRTY